MHRVTLTGRHAKAIVVSADSKPNLSSYQDATLSATSRGALLPDALLPRRRSRSISFADSTASLPPPLTISSVQKPAEADKAEASTTQKSVGVDGGAVALLSPKNLGERAEVAWKVVRSVGGKAVAQAAKELREGAVEVAKLVADAMDEHNEDAGTS